MTGSAHEISGLQKCVDDVLGSVGHLTAEVSSSRTEIREVRDLVMKQNGSFTDYVRGHAEIHRDLGKRLSGLDKADKDATGSIAILEHEIGKPKDTNGRWHLPTVKQVRESLYLVMILAALAGAAWNGVMAPSKDDIEQTRERIDSVASAYEAKIEPTVKAATEVKKSQAEIRKLVELMNQALGAEILPEAEAEVMP